MDLVHGNPYVGFPSVCHEYVLLPLVNKEATLDVVGAHWRAILSLETAHSLPSHPDVNNSTETVSITTLFDQ